MSDEVLNVALMMPKEEMYLDIGEKNVMSVMIPEFNVKFKTADENDIYSYGFADTSSDLDEAVKAYSEIMPSMIRLAEVEKAEQMFDFGPLIEKAVRETTFKDFRAADFKGPSL